MHRWDPVEGKKYLFKVFAGDTRTMVAYLNESPRNSGNKRFANRDFHVSKGFGIPNRIAHYVLDRSAELLPRAQGRTRLVASDPNGTALVLRLEIPIDRNFLDEVCQLDPLFAT